VTAITGPPLIGKTSLVEASLDQPEEPLLVGWASSSGERSDLLLRSLADLYTKWLASASLRDQALMLWRRRQGTTTEAVGRVVAALLKAAPGVGEVAQHLSSLADSNEVFRTGLVLPRLSIDIATELVLIVRELSGRSVVLVLDNFERSPNLVGEINLLVTAARSTSFPAHLVVICRDETGLGHQLTNLARESALVERIRLGRLRLDDQDQARLLEHLHQRLPASRTASEEALMELVNGFPGVIHWWLERPDRPVFETFADLASAASDAHQLLYRELGELLARLSTTEQRLAARIALLPEISDTETSLAFKARLPTCERDRETLESLQAKGILDPTVSFPSFGHSSRYEAAGRYLREDPLLAPALALELRSLLDALLPRFTLGPAHDFIVNYVTVHLLASTGDLGFPEEYGIANRLLPLPVMRRERRTTLTTFDNLTRIRDLGPLTPIALSVGGALLDLAAVDTDRRFLSDLIDRLSGIEDLIDSSLSRALLASAYANVLNYQLLDNDYDAAMVSLARVRDLASRLPQEPLLGDEYARALSQVIARGLGASISDAFTTLLRIAYLSSPSDFERVREQVEAPPSLLEPSELMPLKEELQQLHEKWPASKPVRDFLLQTHVRWIRFASNADLDVEQGALAAIRRKFPDSPLTLHIFVEGTYHCLARDVMGGRFDRADGWLNQIRNGAAEGEYDPTLDHWLFLALIDASDFLIDAGISEQGKALWSEIVDTARSRPGFRHWLAVNSVGRVVSDERELAVASGGLERLALLSREHPDDADVREHRVMAVGHVLAWSALHPNDAKFQELQILALTEHQDVLSEAKSFAARRYGAKAKKLVRRLVGRQR